MSQSYRENFQNTIMNVFPGYLRKEILKQTISHGMVVNCKNETSQLSLKLSGTIDVSDRNTLDSKTQKIIQEDKILKYIEEFAYQRQYRHFCYFKFSDIPSSRIEELVRDGAVKIFDKSGTELVDEYDKPTLYISDDLIYFKFLQCLSGGDKDNINFQVICVLDEQNKILELRFDRVGIAYKNSYNFYREKIEETLGKLQSLLDIKITDIDFKAVVDYIKINKEDVTIYAQRLQRNGTTAYLEAYDDGDNVMPILGELGNFIDDNSVLFEMNESTVLIRKKLLEFIHEIDVKSDMPMVKIKLDEYNIEIGITHNYKGMPYSLFMFYGELLGGREVMELVRSYLIECSREFEEAISNESVSGKKM